MHENLHPYHQTSQFTDTLGGAEIVYRSKPGLPDWREITPAERLLAEHARLPGAGRILLLNARHGALAVALWRDHPGCELWLMDSSALALHLARQTLELNEVCDARIWGEIDLPPVTHHTFDAVVIQAPKSRKLLRRWLALAGMALCEGGLLFIGGENDGGVRAAIADAEALFGEAAVLGYKKGSRVARLVKSPGSAPAPDWLDEEGIAPGSWMEYEMEVPAGPGKDPHRLRLSTLPGVFALGKLDEGTRLLLETAPIPSGGRVLDLGCGCGVIGLAAALGGAAWVDLVDVDLYALAAARRNLERCQVANAAVSAGDGLLPLQPALANSSRYDLILSNPPFHSGQGVDYGMTHAFIDLSRQALAPGGELWLVANRFIPYRRQLEAAFRRVDCPAGDGRFQVLRAREALTRPSPGYRSAHPR